MVFVFMFTYTLATISQCFCISVFFSKANLAAASAGIIYFCTYLPYPLCVTWEEFMRIQEKMIAVSMHTVKKYKANTGYLHFGSNGNRNLVFRIPTSKV